MLKRIWRLLTPREQRRLVGIAPLLALAALVEVVGVATVIPFLVVLTDPSGIAQVPVIGELLAALEFDSSTALLRWVGVALAVTLVLANALIIATQWWMLRFSNSLFFGISTRLLRHHLEQPYIFITGANSASLSNRVLYDVTRLIDNGIRALLDLTARSVSIAAIILFLILLDPVTALVAFLVVGGLYAGVFAASRRFLSRMGREGVVLGAARLTALQEAYGGFKDLRVSGREGAAWNRYLGPTYRLGVVQAMAAAAQGLPRYALEAIAVGGLVVIASVMAGNPSATVATLPLLGAYAFAGLRLMPALQTVFGAFSSLRYAQASLEAIERDFALQTNLENWDEPTTPPLPFHEAIELRDITFTYPSGDRPALKGVTLRIPRHRKVAIVGKTGSGKTTLVDVLLGLLQPASGSLTVDGVVVSAADMRRYRRLFGYVPQFIYLSDDTIAHNVAFGIPANEVDMAAVTRACREAQIADFIEHELPDGYHTRVGERGVRLSGGQRQRIGIARALYAEPDILVFDEATSALDMHTEAAVYHALENIARERTVVTIAHRLDTIAQADLVVMLEAGEAVRVGDVETVLAHFKER